MHDLPLITTIATAFTAAWLLGLLAQKVGLSPIVGYLVAGTLVGPHTPGFQGDLELAQQLAEVGVILLMFDVGLHFSLRELLDVKGVAIPGAVGQSLVATALGGVIFAAFGFPLASGLVIGMAMAVASTVVLMRVLMDADALDSPPGHVAVGWLLVEDIFTVIVLVLIPVLGNGDGSATLDLSVFAPLGLALAKLTALTAIVLVAGAKVIPWVLLRVARLRSRELFTLTVLVFSIAVAAASYYFFGASMALGAFLAGMVVAQSPVSHQAAADALPMRDTFAVLFFVSVGMIFNPAFLWQQPWMVLAGLAIVLVAKPLTALVIVAALGSSARTALTVAIGLAQIGEFSFVLSELARQHGLMPAAGQNVLIATAILSISLNPLLFRSLPKIEQRLKTIPWLWNLLNARAERKAREQSLVEGPSLGATDAKRLAIVVGYGPVGRTVVRLLADAGLQTVVIEMNVDTVAELKRNGQAAIYGDATRPAILSQAGVEAASHLVVTLPQSRVAVSIVAAARLLNPELRILVRAHYLAERDDLERAGATSAVFEEGEAAVALARLVLSDTGASREVVDRSLRDVRLRLILENVAHLNERPIRGIMVPWPRVSRLMDRDTLEQVRRKVTEKRFSRWPVVDSATGRPIGYLLAKDLIAEASTATDWMRLLRKLHQVRPDDTVESALQFMQQEGATLCVVAERGVPLGLVTVENILEQVVGKMEDEYPREAGLTLSSLLTSGAIVPDLMAHTAEEAIAELAAAIPADSCPTAAHVAELALARERQLATHIGFGVAIPHAACPELSRPVVAFGRSQSGIVFGSEAAEPVHLVFLLASPAAQPELHVYLLSRIATVAGQAGLRDRLRRAQSTEEIMELIRAGETRQKRDEAATMV